MAFPNEQELNQWRQQQVDRGVAPSVVDNFINKKRQESQESVEELSGYVSAVESGFPLERLSAEDQIAVFNEMKKRGIEVGAEDVGGEEPYSLETDPVAQRKMFFETEEEKEEREEAMIEAEKFKEVGGDLEDLSPQAYQILQQQGFDFNKFKEEQEQKEKKTTSAAVGKMRGMLKSGLESLSRLDKKFGEDEENTVQDVISFLGLTGAKTTGLPFGIGEALGIDLTPFGRGIEQDLFNVGDAILRLRTGAQANKAEIRRFIKNKLRIMDPGATKQDTLNLFRTELEEAASSIGMENLPEKPGSSPSSTRFIIEEVK